MVNGRPTEWTDPHLGRLTWDDEDLVWVGQTDFNGRQIRVEIDPDRKSPTRERQLAVLEPARKLLVRVLEDEPELRRQAAAQIGASAKAPKHEIDRFEKTLVLEVVTLHGSGEAHYRNDEFLSDWVITVFFDEDSTNVEAEAYPPVKAKPKE